jgi:hypothetical protein
VVTSRQGSVKWALLSYRVPRDPSTPRIAIWRRLRRLGVASLGDGLVGLPEDARTREQLEWAAQLVEEAGGTATLWRAETLSQTEERRIAQEMAAARAAEYLGIVADAQAAEGTAGSERSRQLRRLRRSLREVQRRDYFPPAERERARIAVERLADAAQEAAGARGGRP